MKVNFDLQRAQFAEDESDNEIKMPYRDLIHMYNKEYSLMMAQTKKFYSQCKATISSTLSLNQMGMGFSVPFLLQKFLLMENSIQGPSRVKENYKWNQAREKYQLNFHDILSRMGQVIEQLLQFEIDIKLAYLGQEVKSSTNRKNLKKEINIELTVDKNKILDETSSVSHRYSSSDLKFPNVQDEKVLRGILIKNMTPQRKQKTKVCHKNRKPGKNLDQLLQKTQNLCNHIKADRVKEDKAWDTFNEKRPNRLIEQAQLQKWEINGLQNFLKAPDHGLSDEPEGNDSQRNNKQLYETFQTYFD